MSKSKGNVVNPDSIVNTFGADTLRTYEMFMGPFDQAIAWGEENILGVRRFLERVWRLQERVQIKKKNDPKFQIILHKTIKKVSDDIEVMAFNTAVSAMMILVNEMERQESVSKEDYELFLKVLSPFAPHITEEIWSNLGHKKMIVFEKWPKADPKKMVEFEVKIAVSINGRVRAETVIPKDMTEGDIMQKVRVMPDVSKWLLNKQIEKVIYVPQKLINIIII